ncbi:adenylyl-sulfate kinase [Undibacterium macrobrachii]|uniref:Adenylyl-sulfate kinase n=2 Tax=Undibacterium macrobrachii TaxID=1119058 RepID=A0ABQ2XDB2_9BURK|nr:adenylyl-sulfate kinase [Undibacterium macrobrachii]
MKELVMTKISKNVQWQHIQVSRQDREKQNEHRSCIIWLTGLSGAGKSTLAQALDLYLFEQGMRSFVLDGDNVRHGLCGDLGFANDDRVENIRRVGEVAKLFLDAGVIVIAAFISPFKQERDRVRALVADRDFIEVYCECPLTVCERRDVKGLYKKARSGDIANFTGISSPYEVPESPEIIVNTHAQAIDECINDIVAYLSFGGYLDKNL